MDNTVSAGRKSTTLGSRVWACLLIFGFVGQIAWMVENVYFSTYIQKNITAAGWATSATVSASAIAAALATFFSAAWSDRVGRRRSFVCWGYILWGATTAAFALFGNGQVALRWVLRWRCSSSWTASCPPSARRRTTRRFPPGSRT